MRIISEKTNKEYKTIAECLEAEKEYDAKVQAEKEKKDQLAKERTERAKAVEAAYDAAMEAADKYYEELKKFCDDYGAFHRSYFSNKDNKHNSALDIFWDLFF